MVNGKKSGSGKKVNRNSKPGKRGIPRVKGKGDYKVVIDKLDRMMRAVPRGTFAAMGGAAGGPVGAAIGAGISAVTGYGDYTVTSNTLAKRSAAVNEVPSFSLGKGIRVQHREYLSEVLVPASPGTFTNRSFRLNPGNGLMFPWLSKLANQYQQYKVRGMVVYFKSTSSEYTAAQALGSIVIATNYNVVDANYANLIEMQNSEFCVSAKPSLSLVHAIECDPSKCAYKQYYTASENLPVSPTNDFANVQVATAGLAATAGSSLGQLWISYDIELIKPVIGVGGSTIANLGSGTYFNWAASLGAPLGDATNLVSFTASQIRDYNWTNRVTVNRNGLLGTDGSLIDISLIGAANRLSLYRAGEYLFNLWQVGTVIPLTGYVINAGVNCTISIVANGSASSSSASAVWRITVPSASYTVPATFDLDWVSSVASVTQSVLQITYSPS